MVTIPQATSPFIFTEPIVSEQGLPTTYFLRKWQELLEINSANSETIELVNQILATQFTADNGIEGGGTLEENEDINYGLTETGVEQGTYTAPTLTVDERGRITSIADGAASFFPTISSYFDGAPGADDVLTRFVLTIALTFPDEFLTSQGFLETAATAITVFDIQSNGVSIGSMTFAASGTVATFTSVAAGDTVLAIGDRISVIAPNVPDATAANISFSLQTV